MTVPAAAPDATPAPLAAAGDRPGSPATGRAGRPGPAEATEPSEQSARRSFYDRVGGHDTFVRLVEEFYRGVAADPVLRAMYPEEDLGPASERLLLFLEQYWGGPTTYSETRGHPRLRMRHAPYRVDPDARDRWLACMRGAVDSLGLAPLPRAELWDYLERAAHSLVNAWGDAEVGA